MAEKLFVDTNAWLRFLVRDDEAQHAAINRLLASAEDGEFSLAISHLVAAELEWTMRSFYGRNRQAIVRALRLLLGLRSIQTERRHVLEQVLDSYEQHNVDFVDAYNAADMRARGIETIVSYDRDFDRLGARRLAP